MQVAINNTQNEVATEVVPAVVSITTSGTTMTERRKSVLQGGMSEAGIMMMAGLKGKDGTFLRERIVDAGVDKAIKMACNGTYRPLAEVFAIKTGQSITINSVDDFNSLPYSIGMLINAERAKGKSNGTKVDAKTGLTVDNPKVAALMELHSLMTEAVKAAKAAYEARNAAREAKRLAEQAN